MAILRRSMGLTVLLALLALSGCGEDYLDEGEPGADEAAGPPAAPPAGDLDGAEAEGAEEAEGGEDLRDGGDADRGEADDDGPDADPAEKDEVEIEEPESDAAEAEGGEADVITDYRAVDLVDPFIATGGVGFGIGSGFPGVTAPFGMVQISPDNIGELGRASFYTCGGYYSEYDTIMGFSHVHLYGVGANDLGNILFMPTCGPIDEAKVKPEGYRSGYDKEEETAGPGYYSVLLADTGIRVELTATERTAHHRYSFPEDPSSEEVFVLIDLAHSVSDNKVKNGEVRLRPDEGTVEGWAKNHNSFSGRYNGLSIYFFARFNRPFSSFGTWKDRRPQPGDTRQYGGNVGAYLGFDLSKGRSIEAQVGISYVSVEQAKINLLAEQPGWDFDGARQRLEDRWEAELSVLRFYGGTEKQREIMATALYHAFFMPNLFADVNGKYRGFDQQIHEAEDFVYYTNFSLWDTYRTEHPLLTLLKPGRTRDMMNSLVKMYEQGGSLPKWPMGIGYTGCMLGSSADVVIGDAYVKGIRGFDAEKAYEGMRLTAMGPAPPGASGRGGIDDYVTLGYVSTDHGCSVSRTLEFAIDDYAIANMARALGKADDAALFTERARNYRHLWDDDAKFFIGRDMDGAFVTDFDPTAWKEMYVEGNAWQYLWLAPQDMAGLMALFGSADAMLARLTDFFDLAADELEEAKDDLLKQLMPPTYYWHGNEPDIHAAYMFLQTGRPDLTQKWVHWIADRLYGTEADGLAGNDDCGTLSAWYVFSALGFYPLAGGEIYLIGSPFFKHVEVDLSGGTLVVEAPKASPENIYVQGVWLNGEELEHPCFRHGDIKDGGTLLFELGSEPSDWGSDIGRCGEIAYAAGGD